MDKDFNDFINLTDIEDLENLMTLKVIEEKSTAEVDLPESNEP